jgi:SNF2 family DNA or RNA helicase
LRDAGLGAMLADDMGLGKTLQMICALRGKSLIVAPTSVIFNWAAEIAKFRPGLKVCLYYGAQRSIDETADVVLTSYGVLRIDQEFLRAQSWDSIVLDEAQTIKNPDSQVTRAAHSLSAPFKATLSGTPVENRLDDLWSQFAFINPGLLGTRNEFYEKYARLIVQGEAHAAIDLKARIKPFILRRLKREVAPELPPRTEVVLNCELDAQERATYESLLASTRQEVLQSLEGGGGSVIKALEVILRLRQACCHTALIPGMEAETSSKVNLLLDTLEESLSEGHRSLVFSQWTSFLDLIGDQLKRSGIRYSRIDGSTANRQALVNEFQREDGPPVMLISLKAGGVGLTLTAADHVFITDPWWNPAVEDQAADRAHRIGQENPVMIHRLVAKDTIEERIVALQESKKGLAKAVLDEGGAALSLTREDLLNLLR